MYPCRTCCLEEHSVSTSAICVDAKKTWNKQLTLTAEENGQVPQLGHVEGLKNLTLVRGTITVEDDGGVRLLVVLLSEGQTGANGYLGTDDTVTTVEVLGEHVHRTTLAVRDTLTAAEKLTDDGLDGTTTHHGKTVTTVSGNNFVHASDGVLNSDSDSFLSDRQMAETPDLLLLVQTIGGHLHTSAKEQAVSQRLAQTTHLMLIVPHRDHVVVHLLELLLGGLESVRGWVELISLEALIGETDSEQLVILLL